MRGCDSHTQQPRHGSHLEAHTHTLAHTDTHTFTYTCTHTLLHTHTQTRTHALKHIHMHPYSYTCTHLYMHRDMHMHSGTHMHTYTYTCTHAITHMCTLRHTRMCTCTHIPYTDIMLWVSVESQRRPYSTVTCHPALCTEGAHRRPENPATPTSLTATIWYLISLFISLSPPRDVNPPQQDLIRLVCH